MANSTVQDIIDVARFILSDADGSRWTNAELIAYINSAVRQIVVLKPEAREIGFVYTAALGFTGISFELEDIAEANPSEDDIQRPVAFTQVLNIAETFGPTHAGQSARPVEQDVLDQMVPDWRTKRDVYTQAEADARIDAGSYYQNFVYRKDRPKHAFLYPIGHTYGGALVIPSIRLVVTTIPTSVTATTDELALIAEYDNAVIFYTCYLALMREGRAKNVPAAQEKYQLFIQSLGIEHPLGVAYRPIRPPDEQ